MKIQIEVDVPDNFEPCAYGCFDQCPFSHWDYYKDNGYTCELKHFDNDGEDDEITCHVKKAMELQVKKNK